MQNELSVTLDSAESPAMRRAFCFCMFSLHLQRDGRGGPRSRCRDGGSTTKLQKAGRAFLLRLVAEYGPSEAARVLRALADELEAIGANSSTRRAP